MEEIPKIMLNNISSNELSLYIKNDEWKKLFVAPDNKKDTFKILLATIADKIYSELNDSYIDNSYSNYQKIVRKVVLQSMIETNGIFTPTEKKYAMVRQTVDFDDSW
jgi:hypothetical protein